MKVSTDNRKLPKVVLSSVLVCGVLGGGAWADDAPAEPSGEVEERPHESDRTEYVEVNVSYLPTSNTIATKLPVPLHLTPANVGVVSLPVLLEQKAAVLGDALRNVSGLNVQSGTGIHDYFVIRGFDSLSSGLIMTDGAWEPAVTFYPMYNVEGVEVLKAPSGFLYGPNPLAGVVNIVRKQPVPNDFAVFSSSFGSFGTFDGALDWNQASEEGDRNFRLNGFWRESDHYRDGKESRLFAVNPSFAWRLGNEASVNLNVEYVDAEFTPDTGLPLFNNAIPDVPRRRSYQLPADFSDQVLYRVQVDFERRVSDVLTLRNKTYYRDLDWETAGTLFNGVLFDPDAGADVVSRTLTSLDDRQKFTGNQFEAILSLTGGAVEHHLLAGLEIARLQDEFAAEVVPPEGSLPVFGIPNIGLLDPVETFQGVGFTVPLSAGDTTSKIVAPYVIDQMKVSDAFQVMIGARYDDIDFEDDLNAVERDDSELSPMAGVVYTPGAELSIYLNGGKSFAPASPRVVGEFEPEESEQVELGAKKRFFRGRLRTSFAVYRVDRENIAILDDNGLTQQAGDQRSRGFEFDLAAEMGLGLRAFVSYAFTDAELTNFTENGIIGFDPTGPLFGPVDRTGNTPAFAPEHLASFWISKTFRNGFGVGGGGRYIGEQFIAEDNVFEIDDALVLDATVFYNFSDWRLRLNFKNLTDTDYETRGFGSTSVIPADAFSVQAGFEYHF